MNFEVKSSSDGGKGSTPWRENPQSFAPDGTCELEGTEAITYAAVVAVSCVVVQVLKVNPRKRGATLY
jgi:hypothetical protein